MLENQQPGCCEVHLSTPSGAFWSVMVIDDQIDPNQVLLEQEKQVRSEFESVESSPHNGYLGELPAKGHDLYFYCLDFLVAMKSRWVEAGENKLVITFQAENREFEQLEPVFMAITTSMLKNLTLTDSAAAST